MKNTLSNQREQSDSERPVIGGEDEAQSALGRTRTTFLLYLSEIGRIRLLSPEEEVSLARRIQRGDETAREEMIKANLRLVVKIARDYEGCGVPLLDLINEGNIGLMKAVERFNPDKGAKLSTYAALWIKQSIRRALSNQSRTIRLPVHVGDKLLRVHRASARLEEELGREPADAELAGELNMPTRRLAALRTAALVPASLDAPIGSKGSQEFGDIVLDEKSESPAALLEQKTTLVMLEELLRSLPERERTILAHRFGLNGQDEETLEEVGAHFGVTRERVRQLQNHALGKLRKMIEERETAQLAA